MQNVKNGTAGCGQYRFACRRKVRIRIRSAEAGYPQGPG